MKHLCPVLMMGTGTNLYIHACELFSFSFTLSVFLVPSGRLLMQMGNNKRPRKCNCNVFFCLFILSLFLSLSLSLSCSLFVPPLLRCRKVKNSHVSSFTVSLCLSMFFLHFRTSVLGCDLNRGEIWTNPSDLMHPEIWIAKKEIQEIARKYVSDTGQFFSPGPFSPPSSAYRNTVNGGKEERDGRNPVKLTTRWVKLALDEQNEAWRTDSETGGEEEWKSEGGK